MRSDREGIDMGFKNNINVSSRLRKLAISYGIIWAVLVLSFWPFYNNSQMAMLHVIVVQYVALPIIIFVFSVIVATIHIPLRYAWTIPSFFTISYLIYRLFTLSLAQLVLAGVASFPDVFDFVAGVLISAIGMLIGTCVGALRKR